MGWGNTTYVVHAYILINLFINISCCWLRHVTIYLENWVLGGVTRVSKGLGRDVCCPFVLGQKNFPVPLSRDKKVLHVLLSLWPGTRAGENVPGQTPLSRDVLGQNDVKKKFKKDQISCFRTSFSYFSTSFPVLELPFLF